MICHLGDLIWSDLVDLVEIGVGIWDLRYIAYILLSSVVAPKTSGDEICTCTVLVHQPHHGDVSSNTWPHQTPGYRWPLATRLSWKNTRRRAQQSRCLPGRHVRFRAQRVGSDRIPIPHPQLHHSRRPLGPSNQPGPHHQPDHVASRLALSSRYPWYPRISATPIRNSLPLT
jgi:hypothetical protein